MNFPRPVKEITIDKNMGVRVACYQPYTCFIPKIFLISLHTHRHMSKLLSFTDIEGTLQSKTGRNAAMISELGLSGFQIARGFIISSDDVRSMLMSNKVRGALTTYLKGFEEGIVGGVDDADGPRDNLLNAILSTRLPWDTEMEAIMRFRELDTLMSIKLSTLDGKRQLHTFAHSESSFINAVGKLVGDWLINCPPGEMDRGVPALMVQEVVEAEASIGIRQKKDGFDVRAIFGLPEGLSDPAISSDHYHFDRQLQLVETREKEQVWQHVAGEHGIERVGVLEGFRAEPKLSQEQLDNLIGVMSYMLERPELEEVLIAMVDDSPIIMNAMVNDEDIQVPLTLAHRKQSHSLIQADTKAGAFSTSPDDPGPFPDTTASPPPDPSQEQDIHTSNVGQPVLHPSNTRLVLRVEGWSLLDSLVPSDISSILLLGEWVGPSGMADTLGEAFRKFPNSNFIIQIRSEEPWMRAFMASIHPLMNEGKQISIMLPEARTLADHQKMMKLLAWTIPDDMPMPEIWVSLAYPSNLFFINEMAGGVDVISTDLESLAANLGGHGEADSHIQIRYDDHSITQAVNHLADSVKRARKKLSVHSPSFKTNPGLLERLLGQKVDILAVSPGDMEIVSQLVHSLEEKGLAQ